MRENHIAIKFTETQSNIIRVILIILLLYGAAAFMKRGDFFKVRYLRSNAEILYLCCLCLFSDNLFLKR